MRYLCLISFSFLLIGCNEDVHYSALNYGISGLETAACFKSEGKERTFNMFYRDLPEQDRHEFEIELIASQDKCNTITTVRNDVMPSLEKLDSGYRVPKKRFLFNVISTRDFRTPVGLYKNEGQCQEARERMVQSGYNCTQCYERTIYWNSVWR